jgi:hypothetical protein
MHENIIQKFDVIASATLIEENQKLRRATRIFHCIRIV